MNSLWRSSLTFKLNQEHNSMEVHHHGHHGHEKKTWKSYFWEFFMLFLAVFCGFLAELQLEHYIEHQREKKYVFRIYNDLKTDTAFYKNHAKYQMGVYRLLDSAVTFLDKGTYKNNPDLFYNILLKVRSTRYLEYYSTAFDQMKTSGNLRLIQKENILDSILNYYYGIEKRALVADNRYLETVTETNKALNRFWDAGEFIQIDSNIQFKSPLLLFKTSNATFPDVPFIHLLELKNILFQRKLQIVSLRNFTLRLDLQATSLIKLIEEEYHLK
jgi:hypothetical protein